VGLVAAACAGEPSARDLYKQGRKYEKKGEFARAYLLYSQAAAAEPKRTEYWQRAQALQRRAITQSNVMPAAGDVTPNESASPPSLPPTTTEEMAEARKPQPPVELQSSTERRDFDLKADSKSIWEQVTKAYGLDVVFDGDFQPGPVIRFSLNGSDYREALHALMTATGTFFVPRAQEALAAPGPGGAPQTAYDAHLAQAKALAKQDPKIVANVVKNWVAGNE
jgi:hypothetical protein